MNYSQRLKLGICATTSLLLGVGCGAKAIADEGNGNTNLPSDSGFAFMQRDVEREYPAFVRARWVSSST